MTFVGIRGGKQIFLIQMGGEEVYFNPYSTTFACLLVGLFTERSYGIIFVLFDNLAKKLEEAFK